MNNSKQCCVCYAENAPRTTNTYWKCAGKHTNRVCPKCADRIRRSSHPLCPICREGVRTTPRNRPPFSGPRVASPQPPQHILRRIMESSRHNLTTRANAYPLQTPIDNHVPPAPERWSVHTPPVQTPPDTQPPPVDNHVPPAPERWSVQTPPVQTPPVRAPERDTGPVAAPPSVPTEASQATENVMS